LTRAGFATRVERLAALFAGGQVRAGATVIDGRLVEWPGRETQPEAAQTILIHRSWQLPRRG